MISIRPTQNVGSEKPRIEPVMIVRPATPFGLRPAHSPSGMPSTIAISHRGERELHRRRHPLEDKPERGRAVHERVPEIAVKRAAQERDVLLPQRLVEPERRDRVLALDLVGLRVDQDVDRVADRVDADEHEQRHHEQHDDALQAAADDVDEHRGYGGTPET